MSAKSKSVVESDVESDDDFAVASVVSSVDFSEVISLDDSEDSSEDDSEDFSANDVEDDSVVTSVISSSVNSVIDSDTDSVDIYSVVAESLPCPTDGSDEREQAVRAKQRIPQSKRMFLFQVRMLHMHSYFLRYFFLIASISSLILSRSSLGDNTSTYGPY